MSEQTSRPTPQRPGAARFFTWLRGLGIVRGDGWISGVCGGIAARIGIDPLIVRGVAIVAALLGAPAFLFYAAAWLLLPDADDVIHLETLLRGAFEPVIIVIGVLALLDFLPVDHGLWWLGGGFASGLWQFGAGLMRVLWNLAIVAAIIWFVVWLVRRVRHGPQHPLDSRSGGAEPAARTASAPGAAAASSATFTADGAARVGPAAGPAAGPSGPSGETDAAAAPLGAPFAEPSAPVAPGAGATPDDIAAWREQHTAWRAQRDAWRAQQRADQRLIREQRSAEIRARSRAMAAEALQQARVNRATRPRTSGWYIALSLGVALLAGGIAAAVAATSTSLSGLVAPVGLAAALIAVGVAMVVAGLLRRRAGFLAFVAIALTLLTAAGFAVGGSTPSIGYTSVQATGDVHYSQLAGHVEVDASAEDATPGRVHHIVIDQVAGSVGVFLGTDVHATVEVISHDSQMSTLVGTAGQRREELSFPVTSSEHAAAKTVSYTSAPGEASDFVITIRQRHGDVVVHDQNPKNGQVK